MSFKARALLLAFFAIIYLSFTSLTLGKDAPPKNFILIVPEALPSLGVKQTNAPAIASLRSEGVSFTNSHSGFPRLNAGDGLSGRSDLQVQLLVSAAARKYSAALVPGERGSDLEVSGDVKHLVDVTLPRFKAAGRPFLLIYRIAEPKYAPP